MQREDRRASPETMESTPNLLGGLFHDGTELLKKEMELARAEIAWRLGKRYVQDQPLDWGCALEQPAEDLAAWCAPGTTLRAVNE